VVEAEQDITLKDITVKAAVAVALEHIMDTHNHRQLK
jgi:hypothetical protein